MGRKTLDLTNQTFGRLLVLKEAGRDKRGGAFWSCECQCHAKTIVTVRGQYLRSGNTKSCGCWARECASMLWPDKKRSLKINASRLANHTLQSNNTSGVTGVGWVKERSKWAARICYQCKQYRLGYFDVFEDAVAARKEAEERIHGPFLDWYEENIKALPNRQKEGK